MDDIISVIGGAATKQGTATEVRITKEAECTWQLIEEILAAGEAREVFGDEGQITVHVEGIGDARLR